MGHADERRRTPDLRAETSTRPVATRRRTDRDDGRPAGRRVDDAARSGDTRPKGNPTNREPTAPTPPARTRNFTGAVHDRRPATSRPLGWERRGVQPPGRIVFTTVHNKSIHGPGRSGRGGTDPESGGWSVRHRQNPASVRDRCDVAMRSRRSGSSRDRGSGSRRPARSVPPHAPPVRTGVPIDRSERTTMTTTRY